MNFFSINEHYEISRPIIYRIVYVALSIIICDFAIWLIIKILFNSASDYAELIPYIVIISPIVISFLILALRYFLGIRNKVKIVVDGDKITFYSGMSKRTHRIWDIKGTDYMEDGNPYGLYICFGKFERYGIFLYDINSDKLLKRLEMIKFVRKTEVFYEPVKSTRFGKA